MNQMQKTIRTLPDRILAETHNMYLAASETRALDKKTAAVLIALSAEIAARREAREEFVLPPFVVS